MIAAHVAIINIDEKLLSVQLLVCEHSFGHKSI